MSGSDTPSASDENGGDDDSESEKSKNILIEVTPEQFEELSKTKKENGFTWLGMLLHAQRCLRRENERW
jgi:hypothetical protein